MQGKGPYIRKGGGQGRDAGGAGLLCGHGEVIRLEGPRDGRLLSDDAGVGGPVPEVAGDIERRRLGAPAPCPVERALLLLFPKSGDSFNLGDPSLIVSSQPGHGSQRKIKIRKQSIDKSCVDQFFQAGAFPIKHYLTPGGQLHP